MRNPFHGGADQNSDEVKEKYTLLWEVELTERPEGEQWLPGVSGLELELEAATKDNPIPEKLDLKAEEVIDIEENGEITKKIVSLNVDRFRELEMFKLNKDAEENPEEVRFRFRAFTTDGELETKGNDRALKMTPFYNAEKLLEDGWLYNGGGGTVSMFGTWSTYKKIREMKNNLNGVLFNDVSLPFGGEFDPHESKAHESGTALDMNYPGGVVQKTGLNLNVNKRFELAKKAAQGDGASLEELGSWVAELRSSLSKMDQIDPNAEYILDTGATRPSDGRDVIGLGVQWHKSAIESGFVLGNDLTENGSSLGVDIDLVNKASNETIFWEKKGEHLGHIHINFGD